MIILNLIKIILSLIKIIKFSENFVDYPPSI